MKSMLINTISSFSKENADIDEDPDRLIYPWCSQIPVPKWAAENAYVNCKHCKAAFKSGHRHNCRLCGELFCSACTGKFHLPSSYELKGKKGTSRVCLTCRDACLEQRRIEKEAEAAAKQQATGPKKKVLKSLSDDDDEVPPGPPPAGASNSKDGVIEMAPPDWEPMDNFVDCAKCHKKGGKAHNCRTCGKLFCSSCTSKMSIPSFFEKKEKDGPARVCDNCRFLIVSGKAKLVEKKAAAEQKEKDKEDGGRKRWGSQSQARLCLVAGCQQARVTKKGYCAAHANSDDVQDSMASDASLAVKVEGETAQLCKIAIQPDAEHMTLSDIDRNFRRQVQYPSPFNYIYNNEIIPNAFFEVFTARVFRGTVFIRPRSELSAVAIEAVATLRPVVEEVPKANNPFKRNEVAVAQEDAKKKREEEEAKNAKPAFKRAAVGRTAAPVLPPPTESPDSQSSSSSSSSSSAAAAASDGGDPFKARAKNVFGAK